MSLNASDKVRMNRERNEAFSRRLKKRRVELGFSREEIAAAVGVKPATWRRIEQPGTMYVMTQEKLETIARVLEVSCAWLLIGAAERIDHGPVPDPPSVTAEVDALTEFFRSIPDDRARERVMAVSEAVLSLHSLDS
ncbi:MAG: helix-turn-helix transcriptional regulator [Alphaproteobacteria bacterium]